MVDLSHSTGSFLQSPIHEPYPGILVICEKLANAPEGFLWPVKNGDQFIQVIFRTGFVVLIQNRTGQGKLSEGTVVHGIRRTIVLFQTGSDHQDDIPCQCDFFCKEIQRFAKKMSILGIDPFEGTSFNGKELPQGFSPEIRNGNLSPDKPRDKKKLLSGKFIPCRRQ
jgi:hypothetical protein